MRRPWAFLVLLSFQMTSLHELSHTFESQDDTNHICTICENQSYNLATDSDNSEIKIVSQTDIKFSFVLDVFVSKINLLRHAFPRAPPTFLSKK